MNALEKVNIAILLATITYIIAINSLLSGTDQIGPGMRWFITFLTSVGLFRLLIILVYWIIRASDTLLAIYHQGRFLKGLWTYRYEVDGVPHTGIWRISQDLASISITGYGIDAKGRIDSHFRSVSPLFEHQGVEEIMFARTDTTTGDEHFAKTTLYVDRLGRPNWRSGPTFMRAQSVLYGHDEDGARHADIILRGANLGQSEARIVEEMCGAARAGLLALDASRPPADRPALVS
ncbi:hypothetical protein MWU52_04270 [Jannaschia sp. S6380]|uniref:hypothetical protein n=1 Tax=Jannaschia sp. S6380 TaxID=2926408 RepID=UPI001FF69240|nr:hypothetical protein [Jannaschia sp. S6380]MCK0166759.1 hypothetical protein [Jannaschia sp. S6380]